MKISSYSPYLYNNQIPKALNFGRQNAAVNIEDADFGDTFVQKNKRNESGFLSKLFDAKIFQKSKEKQAVKNFLARKNKFNISDYQKLSDGEKSAIKNAIGFECLFPASQNVVFASGIKEMLDEKYGEDGYVFVSIGTSPSLIAKVMECMGVETRYLPISKLRNKNVHTLVKEKNFERYGKFLETQGITPENLASRDKKYIFYDYTATNRTLWNFEILMNDAFKLPKEKMEFRSLNKDLELLFKEKIYIDDRDAVYEYIINYLEACGAAKYSTVKSLPVSEIETTVYLPRALTKHDDNNTKFYNFYVMDVLNSKGLLKENPQNGAAL